MAVFAAAVRWGTFAAGGSDSYCYVHQAEAWASGRLQVVEPLALDAPWPNPPLTFAPAGHIPSPTVRGAAVPMCPAGLSIAMAPLAYVGAAFRRPGALFAAVPLFGALLVWSVYVLGARFSPRVGLASALLVACSPAFLFQLMQPMSDVPAAALWVLATVLATSRRPGAPLLAGLATSAAILVRPNLVPMGMVLGAYFLAQGMRPALAFAAASAPGCIAVALIDQMFYGSPLRSGYGTLDGLFAFEHVAPNAARYFTWMSATHTPIWLLALAAPFVLPRRLSARLLSLAAVNVLCYLPYMAFNDWWYLRFLLPAIAMALVLTAAVVDSLLRLWREPLWLAHGTSHKGLSHRVMMSLVTAGLAFLFLREASARSVFELQRLEARYARAGAYVADHLPPNALVVTSWESGSVRFYGHRNTLVWDVLDPAWLDRAVAYTRTRGLEPYLLFERWEEPIFRQRFAGSVLGRLDWPPAAEIAGQVRIYRPDDRDRYFRGDAAPTDYAR